MELTIGSRFKHAWNAFKNNKDPTYTSANNGYYTRPDRNRVSRGTERSIINSIYNRISLDTANINFKHCKLDKNGRFVEEVDSGLNNCLTLEANIDQTAKMLIQDIVMSMLDEGCVAIIPVDTSTDPNNEDSFQVLTLRTGKIVTWYPTKVEVEVYNDQTGLKEHIILDKNFVCIIENPFYSIMNEYNSTLQRLIRKLVLLDSIDEQTGSGKLDLIIQLPYTTKSKLRQDQANQRRQDIADQLAGSKYGIAYIDGTEKVIQLNRSLENNLMKQIEYLTNMLFSQLGMTQAILDGTANDETMLNYYSRTIDPIASAISVEMKRKFLSKSARSDGQSIEYFRDPFKLVPVNNIAEIADKFTRNEIMTSNEIRQVIGMMPSKDPKADELRNSNISHPKEEEFANNSQPINNENNNQY